MSSDENEPGDPIAGPERWKPLRQGLALSCVATGVRMLFNPQVGRWLEGKLGSDVLLALHFSGDKLEMIYVSLVFPVGAIAALVTNLPVIVFVHWFRQTVGIVGHPSSEAQFAAAFGQPYLDESRIWAYGLMFLQFALYGYLLSRPTCARRRKRVLFRILWAHGLAALLMLVFISL